MIDSQSWSRTLTSTNNAAQVATYLYVSRANVTVYHHDAMAERSFMTFNYYYKTGSMQILLVNSQAETIISNHTRNIKLYLVHHRITTLLSRKITFQYAMPTFSSPETSHQFQN